MKTPQEELLEWLEDEQVADSIIQMKSKITTL